MCVRFVAVAVPAVVPERGGVSVAPQRRRAHVRRTPAGSHRVRARQAAQPLRPQRTHRTQRPQGAPARRQDADILPGIT